MSKKTLKRFWIMLSVVVVGIMVWGWMHRFATPVPSASITRPEGYADDSRCAQCHTSESHAFAHGGMGTAFRPWHEATEIEDRSQNTAAVSAVGGFYYQFFMDGQEHVQREFRRDASGVEYETKTQTADYVLGSGIEGRAYLHDEKGYLTILPLGWYSDAARWDLNPGYEHQNHRFNRPVAARCISCHYPMIGHFEGSENRYEMPLGSGIGCQRCHGPGAAHIDQMERKESNGGFLPKDDLVDLSLLPVDRMQDICLQCHLLGDIVVAQPGHDEWSFRPGMSLRDVRDDFLIVDKAAKFTGVGHGPQSMASRCYSESGGKMTCVFCHDPHASAASVSRLEYNSRCLECHSKTGCARLENGIRIQFEGDCVNCHMPQKATLDISHLVSTDHWIRRPGDESPMFEADDGGLAQLRSAWGQAKDPLQLSAAYIRFSLSRGDLEETLNWTSRLESEIEQIESPHALHLHWLATGHLSLGQYRQAIFVSARSMKLDNKVDTHVVHGRALARLSRAAEALEHFESMLEKWPYHSGSDHLVARLCLQLNRPEQLIRLERDVFSLHPDDAERLVLVADAMGLIGSSESEQLEVLDRATAADRSYPQAYIRRARLAAARNDQEALIRILEQGMNYAPDSPEIRVAWAGSLVSERKVDEALEVLRRVLVDHPDHSSANQMFQSLLEQL